MSMNNDSLIELKKANVGLSVLTGQINPYTDLFKQITDIHDCIKAAIAAMSLGDAADRKTAERTGKENCASENSASPATIQAIISLLEPIADREWDSKWRIIKAIGMLQIMGDVYARKDGSS